MPEAIEKLNKVEQVVWFMRSVRKIGTCWEWTRELNHGGYGVLRLLRKRILAHRLSYLLFSGTVPAKLHVLHKCDNRKCVNPGHLFLGTEADNGRDAAIKDRRSQKLTIDDVSKIRGLNGIFSQAVIANRFGVAQSNVSRIMSRQRRPYVS